MTNTATTTKPVLKVKDNGYFEAWTRPCGHSYRITTEYLSGSLKKAVMPQKRKDAAARKCSQCPSEVTA